MAVGVNASRKHLCCSICLDLLKDPVTLPCEHNFCKICITRQWNQDIQTEVWSCPLCKRTFSPRPVLTENVLVAEIVQKLNGDEPRQTEISHTRCVDVECNVCTGRKHKAVKSCVSCLCSYCQDHFDQHENVFTGQTHNMLDVNGPVYERFCHLHHKPLEMYCYSDKRLICYFCTWFEHKNHNIVTAEVERRKKQRDLKQTQKGFQHRIKTRKNKILELKEAMESLDAAVEENEKIFTELIPYGVSLEMTQLIRVQERAAVRETEELLKRLEQEIDVLRGRDAELEKLLHIKDDIRFLYLTRIKFSFEPSLLSLDDVERSVSKLKGLTGLYKDETESVSTRARSIQIPGPKTRQEFLQYYFHFTLDLNTVNEQLHLDNRVITNTDRVQHYPDHPDRFDYHQVLCRESVCGRCYWEVEWSGDSVEIAVSYKSISRKGRGGECRFGFNDQSWKCLCSPYSYSFWHNNTETDLPVVSSSSRIGVYVDHSGGIMSFFSVSDTMTLIYRVHTTFTQPLYPGFGVYSESAVILCDLTK